jgi:exonuclease III
MSEHYLNWFTTNVYPSVNLVQCRHFSYTRNLIARQTHYYNRNTYFLCSGKQEGKHVYGVAFVVKREGINHVLHFKATSKRKCSMRIKTNLGNLCVLKVYAPTDEMVMLTRISTSKLWEQHKTLHQMIWLLEI